VGTSIGDCEPTRLTVIEGAWLLGRPAGAVRRNAGHAYAVAPNPLAVVDGFRDQIASGFRRIVSGDPTGVPDWVAQMAEGTDEGYFGRGSAVWAVHGSLPTLVGGVRALLMQAMHPAALAGVMEHSRYEEDPLGRLAGTTQWLTVTSFGDTAQADRECARVRGLHKRVQGTYATDAGEAPYTASDPDLLRWVHVAFTDSFLATHLAWGGPIPGGPDEYVREWATAGELVGVQNPPTSVKELREQLEGYAPILRGDERTERTVAFIRNSPLPAPARLPYSVLFAGAVATMTPEHRRILKLPTIPMTLVKPSVAALLGTMQLVLGAKSPSQRMAADRTSRLVQEADESTGGTPAHGAN
jgi:uncharacterized protein (DUF2236 family)